MRLVPDPRRVIAKPFVPGEEPNPEGPTRLQIMLQRILAMSERDLVATLHDARLLFSDRHRDLDAVFDRSFGAAAAPLTAAGLGADVLSREQRHLIGAYFTHEYSVESAALSNPSIVAAPDQTGLAAGEMRFVMSLRSIGEGHRSSIAFRTGVAGADAVVRLDARSPFAAAGEPGDERHASDYRVDFPSTADISERVLFPSGATESHGMEDARFVRFVDDDGVVTYFATYTAYDGHQVRPQLLETRDFAGFRVTALHGAAARNKGIALFPRRIDGKFVALGRHDNVNNFLMTSDDVREWQVATVLQEPSRPWELMQLGNCGSPIETEAGWLVITHGVGPFRRYTLGAMLLDLHEPSRVIGHLAEPLLSPEGDEREGYVPNVVYSCGSLIHAGHLVLPYGYADFGTRLATAPLADLLARLTG